MNTTFSSFPTSPCLLIALLLLAAHSAVAAPTIALNAPVMLRKGATSQFAKVTPIAEPGYTYSWALSHGAITDGQGTDLVVFDVPTNVTQTVLTITISNGVETASASQTILLNAPGGNITDGEQTVTFGGENRPQYSLQQLLRGERISVTASAGVQCTLLDAQGRFIAEGASIDCRVPVRGSYLLVFSAPTPGSYTFTVTGVRPPSNPGGEESGVARGTGNAAAQGRTTTIRSETGMTTGEAMTIANGQVVSAIYDHTLRRTRIIALPDGNQPGWEWTSTDDSYVRTLSTGKDGNLYGVGSGGGAGPAADNVYAFKLQPNGTCVWERYLPSNGSSYDYGYGIVADASGRVVVSGFTTGSFTRVGNGGALDAFAIGLNSSGRPQWTRRYATTGDDRIYASVISSAGDAVLFGDTSGVLGTADSTLGPLGSRDLFLIAVDFDGNLRWTRQFGSPDVELAFAIDSAPAGDLYLTGMTSGTMDGVSSDPLNPDVFLIRCSAANGAPVWARQLGAAEGQSAETLFADATGVHVLFYTNGSFPGATNDSRGTRASDDMVIASYDMNGRLLWVQQFDDTSERIFARALAVQDGSIYVLRDHVYVPGSPFTMATIDLLPVQAPFTPSETVVGDPSYGCLGMEFSPDMKWFVWTQQGATKASWLCSVNPDTGDLIPANGRPNGQNGQPFSIPNIPPRGNPQWGRDSTGWFIIAIADDGSLVQVRPGTLGPDGNWLVDPVITYPAVPVNATRQYPFAARLPERAASYVIYQQLANGNGTPGIYWVDLGDPTFTEHVVTVPSGYTMPPTLENIAATIYRWFPGLPIFTYAVLKQPGGAVKMAQLDVSAPVPTPVAINPATDNVSFHTDDFPSVNFGRRTLIGGVNGTATARYYLQNDTTKLTSTLADITVTPEMSALTNPNFASSFEPFEWNGRVYSAFQIIDGSGPLQAVPSEIWLTSLSDCLSQTDTSLLRRINAATSLQRRDPEYFLGTTKAWIYYYAKPSGTLFTIYRAETGLPDVSEETVCTPCLADINGDGSVDGADLGMLLAAWGSADSASDLDGNGSVGGGDLGMLLAAWGAC